MNDHSFYTEEIDRETPAWLLFPCREPVDETWHLACVPVDGSRVDEVPSVFADLARADSHQALDCSTRSLAEWIEAYLAPHGEFYDPAEHFHRWPPGDRWHYCNISYGLLALLAERVGDAPFDTLSRERIVEPLGMTSTAWVLPDVHPARHAVP